MKKFLAVLFTLILSMSMMSCSLAEETVEAKGEGVMTYAEYAAAEIDAEVVIERLKACHADGVG